jgi:hypothetical protein
LLDVGQFGQSGHLYDVTESDSEVLACAFVHPNLIVFSSLVFGSESDADSLSALFAFEKDLVAPHKVEFLHLLFGQLDDGVIVVSGVFNHELVRSLLLGENGLGDIFLSAEIWLNFS